MNKSFVFISMILAFFIISLAAPGVQAQDKEKKLIEMKSSTGSGGEDKNIKSIRFNSVLCKTTERVND